jgi:hypothetical protein
MNDQDGLPGAGAGAGAVVVVAWLRGGGGPLGGVARRPLWP